VLLAACGAGVDVLERCPVATDPAVSVLQLRASALDALAGGTGTLAALAALPSDWRQLAVEVGLKSFLAVPIGPADGAWGALVIASSAADALRGPRVRVWPNVAAVALVHQLRHWQTAAACRLLQRAAAAGDSVSLIATILEVRAAPRRRRRALRRRRACRGGRAPSALTAPSRPPPAHRPSPPRVPSASWSAP
jgi:hypothetical protein